MFGFFNTKVVRYLLLYPHFVYHPGFSQFIQIQVKGWDDMSKHLNH